MMIIYWIFELCWPLKLSKKLNFKSVHKICRYQLPNQGSYKPSFRTFACMVLPRKYSYIRCFRYLKCFVSLNSIIVVIVISVPNSQGTLLEYMECTFHAMDPMEFIQTKESTIGLKVLLTSTTDPKVLLLVICVLFYSGITR